MNMKKGLNGLRNLTSSGMLWQQYLTCKWTVEDSYSLDAHLLHGIHHLKLVAVIFVIRIDEIF